MATGKPYSSPSPLSSRITHGCDGELVLRHGRAAPARAVPARHAVLSTTIRARRAAMRAAAPQGDPQAEARYGGGGVGSGGTALWAQRDAATAGAVAASAWGEAAMEWQKRCSSGQQGPHHANSGARWTKVTSYPPDCVGYALCDSRAVPCPTPRPTWHGVGHH